MQIVGMGTPLKYGVCGVDEVDLRSLASVGHAASLLTVCGSCLEEHRVLVAREDSSLSPVLLSLTSCRRSTTDIELPDLRPGLVQVQHGDEITSSSSSPSLTEVSESLSCGPLAENGESPDEIESSSESESSSSSTMGNLPPGLDENENWYLEADGVGEEGRATQSDALLESSETLS